MPTKVPINAHIVQVAAGSSHTVLLSGSGQVYTFGSQKVITFLIFINEKKPYKQCRSRTSVS